MFGTDAQIQVYSSKQSPFYPGWPCPCTSTTPRPLAHCYRSTDVCWEGWRATWGTARNLTLAYLSACLFIFSASTVSCNSVTRQRGEAPRGAGGRFVGRDASVGGCQLDGARHWENNCFGLWWCQIYSYHFFVKCPIRFICMLQAKPWQRGRSGRWCCHLGCVCDDRWPPALGKSHQTGPVSVYVPKLWAKRDEAVAACSFGFSRPNPAAKKIQMPEITESSDLVMLHPHVSHMPVCSLEAFTDSWVV